MSRTPRNRTNITITDADDVIDYLEQFAKMDIKATGGYSKNINNDGWVTQSGGLDISNQGHIKTIVWSVSILTQRAGLKDVEAQSLIANLYTIVVSATKFKSIDLSASIGIKPKNEEIKPECVDSRAPVSIK